MIHYKNKHLGKPYILVLKVYHKCLGGFSLLIQSGIFTKTTRFLISSWKIHATVIILSIKFLVQLNESNYCMTLYTNYIGCSMVLYFCLMHETFCVAYGFGNVNHF